MPGQNTPFHLSEIEQCVLAPEVRQSVLGQNALFHLSRMVPFWLSTDCPSQAPKRTISFKWNGAFRSLTDPSLLLLIFVRLAFTL